MKDRLKYLLGFLIVLVSVAPLFGQYTLEQFVSGKTRAVNNYDFGIIIGGGVSSAHEPELNRGDWNPTFSYTAGLMARYKLLNHLSIESDLIYNMNEATDYGSIQIHPQFTAHGETTLKTSSLQLPISLLLTTSQKSSIFHLYSGGGFFGAIPLSAKKKIDADNGWIFVDDTYNVKNDFPSLLYGYNGLIGVKVMDSSVELRYCRELNGYGSDKEEIVDVNAWSIRLIIGHSFF